MTPPHRTIVDVAAQLNVAHGAKASFYPGVVAKDMPVCAQRAPHTQVLLLSTAPPSLLTSSSRVVQAVLQAVTYSCAGILFCCSGHSLSRQSLPGKLQPTGDSPGVSELFSCSAADTHRNNDTARSPTYDCTHVPFESAPTAPD